MKKIQIHLDGANNLEIKKYLNHVDGFTFNPSLFRKLGVKDPKVHQEKIPRI